MKKHIFPVSALIFLLLSGGVMAAVMEDNVTLNNEKISGQAWQAMRNVGMSRFELFNGQTQKAEQLASQAEKLLNDDSIDWLRYVKSNKTSPQKGDKYIRINSSITVAEDYIPPGPKTDAINKANQKMKAGDKKGAIDALKLAGISVIENQELIPLQQTRKDVNTALTLMHEGKYYQAGLMLKSAQDSVIVDSQSVQESPAQPVQNNTSH